MAFEGDLSNLGLGDVLQTIAMSRQVGTFILRGEEERRLACGPQGVALLSSKKSLGLRIGTILVGAGKVSQEHLDQALRTQGRHKEMLLGQILVETGGCTEEDVRAARRYLAAEEIFSLFLWKGGQFEFQNGDPDLSGTFADIWFDVPSLAMEAARRLDEMPRILAAIPGDEVFVSDDRPNEHRDSLLQNNELSTLYHLCDASRTVHDLLEDFYRGQFDTLKGLQTLLEGGVIRAATKDEVIAAGRAASARHDYLRAARLYRRASEHDPDNDIIRHAIADALRDAGEKRLASEEMVLVGSARLQSGRGLQAIEAFRTALRLDSANAAAQEGLTHALAGSGLVDEAAESAQTAARLRLQNNDFEGARRVAMAGLGQRPGDAQLLTSLANALHGLDRTSEAVKYLDQALDVVRKAGDARRELDVCRRILQLDPERKDCTRRVNEIQAAEATRRKRLVRRIAVAAGFLVLAAIAVPIIRGASPAAVMERASALLDAKNAEGARALLAGIDENSLDEEDAVTKRTLDARVTTLLRAPEDAATCKAYTDRIERLYGDAVEKIVKDERLDQGMAVLNQLVDCLKSPEAKKVERIDGKFFAKIRTDVAKDVQTALGNAAATSQAVATQTNGLRDRFTDDVWKKEDLDVLHDLISQADAVIERSRPEYWDPVPEAVRQLVNRTKAPKDGSDRVIAVAAASISDANKHVCRDHDRALARARRKELKEGYKSAYANGTQSERDGRLEEALGHYDGFLTQCDDLKKAVPEALYAPIIAELFGEAMQLDQRIRARRERIAQIVRECDEAQKAEAGDEIDESFRIRKHLVLDNPDLDLSRRFQMPLRIETAPPGATVILEDGSPSGRDVGRTPLVTSYPVVGGAKYEVRLAGYRSCALVRKGAREDAGGVERLEPAKIATWTSKAAGMTESPPTAAAGSVLLASRSGVVRRVDTATGEESARFDPGLIDGFAGSAVLRGDSVFAVALDGKGYVLDAKTLKPAATFDSGPTRASPLPTSRGAIVADENGTVRLVDEKGKAVWTKKLGRVKCDLVPAGERALLVTADAELILLEPSTGDVVKRRQLRNEMLWGPPNVHGGRVFLGNEGGEVVCIDAASLEDAWTQRLDGPVRGRVCANDLRVVACTVNGAVHMLDSETGAILSKTLVGGKIEDGACDVADGGFVVITRKGNVTRFDAKAQIMWKFDAGEEVAAPPRIVGGALIVVTRKGVAISLAP
jgi:outer membrane protein assembly factor BamB/tetratricopeptide (TPR) repeat protein